MPAIYTTEWYEAIKKLLNENPEVDKNSPRGTFHVLARIVGDARSLYLPVGELRNFVVLFTDGKCLEYRQVDAPPPRKDFEFIFELPASVFEDVAAGQMRSHRRGTEGQDQNHRRHANPDQACRVGKLDLRGVRARSRNDLAEGQARLRRRGSCPGWTLDAGVQVFFCARASRR